MYYLFMTKQEELDNYKKELFRVKKSIEEGKTPVYSELRSAQTMMAETLPYEILSGCFLILGTILLSKLNLPTTISVAVVLVVNALCGCIANYVFTLIKHGLRIKLCRRLKIEPSEENIAAMESLEYQSV